MKIWLVALAAFFLAGCSGSRAVSRKSLDGLRGGMTIEEVVWELGEPTTRVELRPFRQSGVYYDLTYVNSIVNPGVVELFFRPALSEIRVDTELYREY